MKRSILAGTGVLIAMLALPLVNLIQDQPTRQMQAKLAEIRDPSFHKAAVILQNNCAHCHASGTPRPFYASLPPASLLIDQDVRSGLARLDFANRLTGQGEAFSEIELARLENVLADGTMPPLRYTALHWQAMLSREESDTLLGWIRQRRLALRHDTSVPVALAAEPLYPIPLSVSLNAGRVSLGRQLFHDTRLSGDNTLSCASCHALNKGGTDQARVSTGIRGQRGGINAPTVYNAAFHFVQFWDGRAKDLREQAHGPVQNPIEMGATWPQVISRLQADAGYVSAFRNHYPNGITPDNVVDAIVEFERSLFTPNARFDRYLRGDKTALNREELAGYGLFKNHCAACHAGTNIGGLSYEKMGWRRPYFTSVNSAHKDDFGRFNVTQLESDRHYFKVPTLRNVAITWPYFHNAVTNDLREAVRLMAKHQVEAPLSEREIDQITAFLKTLTGEYPPGQSLSSEKLH